MNPTLSIGDRRHGSAKFVTARPLQQRYEYLIRFGSIRS